jgi:hypothetical protein
MAVVASISQQIWDMKYRLKGPSGGTLLVAFILNDPGQLTPDAGWLSGNLSLCWRFRDRWSLGGEEVLQDRNPSGTCGTAYDNSNRNLLRNTNI